MKKLLTSSEIALKWCVTPVRVTVLCKEGRVKGAVKKDNRWLIPEDVQKPKDLRKNQSEGFENDGFRFIDLFAGIGGFHQAMRFLGGQCVMASEIDKACRETYKLNYKTKDIRGDIRKIEADSIGEFDVLCAGFPCQPFSKAGYQKGFEDEGRGDMFYNILRILDGHPEAKFIILENVRNLADKQENWEIIKNALKERGFFITEKPIILSPNNFGLPQVRERVYILGMKKDIRNTKLLKNGYIHIEDLGLEDVINKNKCKMGDAFRILDSNVSDEYRIDEEAELMIQAWDEFRIQTGIGLIGFPIWINSFGVGIEDQKKFKRKVKYSNMPDWKKSYVDSNRELYLNNKEFIDEWIEKYKMFDRIKIYQKFEWNCGNDVADMRESIIQIRQSGIRVKRPTFYPALVAMVNTPIIFDRKMNHYRYLTPREAASLQSFHKKFKFAGTDKQIYKQLGNSVNVKILKTLGKKLFDLSNVEWGNE